MEHPVAAWREARGLSRLDLAMAAGVAAPTVAACEIGVPGRVPADILRLVRELDGPQAAEDLAAAYRAWRRERGRQLLAGRPA